ncbi:MAG: DMT family transporter [Clostridia bacterium]|nr:DMT family transporter [Clostridia bacterium]
MEIMPMRENRPVTGKWYIIGAALLWGLAGVCVKSVSWGPMSLIASRSLLSLIILCICLKKKKVVFSSGNILGAVMMSLTGILYVIAIKLTTAGTAIVLQYAAPILVFLYEIVFRHRKPTCAEILITFAVFGGIVLSFADSLDASHLLGNILAILSAFTFAAQIIIMNRKDTDSGDSLIISCVLSLIASVPFLFSDPGLTFDLTNIFWVCVLGIFQYGLANVLFGIGIRRTEALESSLLLTIEPVFNPIPVALIYGEKMGVTAVIGSVIVIVSVALYGLLPSIRKRMRHVSV